MIRNILALLLGLSTALPSAGCADKLAAPSPDVTRTFTEGEVYLYGNAVPAPYTLAVTDSALLLNGVPVFPKLPSQKAAPVYVTRKTLARDSLNVLGGDLQMRLQREGKSLGEVTTALVEFYRASMLVAEVSGIRPGSFWVHWVGDDHPEEHLVVLETSVRRSWRERIEEEAQQYERFFQEHCLIIVSSSANIYVPPEPASRLDAIREEIRMARNAAPAELRPGQWRGRFISWSIARQFRDPLPLSRGGDR